MNVTYVSYDGLEDPLGRSQVLPYVEGLARMGHHFELLTFEKPPVPLRLREPIAQNVHWTALRYHKTPTVPATAFDMTQGALFSAVMGIIRKTQLLHARSYVSAIMALPWAKSTKTPLLFDMRGLWPDEKVDAKTWSKTGKLYARAKDAERLLLRNAHAITVLTHSMQNFLRDEYPHANEIHAPIRVIPTCTDLDHFSLTAAPDQEVANLTQGKVVLVYVGSLGGWYMDKELAQFYLAWRKYAGPSRFLVISRSNADTIASVLKEHGAADELIHRPATRAQVPGYIRCGHGAISLVRNSFSKRGSAPTKIGELLACGLPVASNIIGDVDRVLENTEPGVLVYDESGQSLDQAAQRLVERIKSPNISQKARDLAENWFSLEKGLRHYARLYDDIDQGQRLHDAQWP